MKNIRIFWNQNPESNVTGYTVQVDADSPITVDRSSPLEIFCQRSEGANVRCSIVANASNGPSSDPSTIEFVVPTDNVKPSPPTGLGWEVVP